MKRPETYYGPWNTYVATDANNDINPTEIATAIITYHDSIDNSLREVDTSLTQVRPDLAAAIRTQNRDLTSRFDDLSQSLQSMGNTFKSVTEGLYRKAVTVHDEKQEQYNNEAAAAAEAEWEEYRRQQEKAAQGS